MFGCISDHCCQGMICEPETKTVCVTNYTKLLSNNNLTEEVIKELNITTLTLHYPQDCDYFETNKTERILCRCG